MIPVNLMDALAERLQVILKDYSAENPPEGFPTSIVFGRNPLKIHTGQISALKIHIREAGPFALPMVFQPFLVFPNDLRKLFLIFGRSFDHSCTHRY